MPAEGYTGPATIVVDGRQIQVELELHGRFQPIDGYYRWYGRIARHPELDALVGGRKRPVRVRTPEGTAEGALSDPDPWGRYRVLGKSTPPFEVAPACAHRTFKVV